MERPPCRVPVSAAWTPQGTAGYDGAGVETAPQEGTWLAPARVARAEVRRRGSRFLAEVAPVPGDAEAEAQLAALRREFSDATHHCWARRLRGGAARASDDGEPAGTAGLPILHRLEAAELEGAALVVVRWFGGVKLGVGPLGQAYRDAAAAALEAAGTTRRRHVRLFRLICPWEVSGEVRRALLRAGGRVREEHPTGEVELLISVPVPRVAALTGAVRDAARGRMTLSPAGEAVEEIEA